MLISQNCEKTVPIVIIFIISSVIASNDYHQNSNEEVTSSSLDFFDAADSSNEFYIQQRKQPPSVPLQNNQFDEGHPHVIPPSPSAPAIYTENVLATTVSSVGNPFQTTPSIMQLYDEEEVYNLTTTSAAINEILPDLFMPINSSAIDYNEDQDEMVATTITSSTTSTVTRTKQGKQIPISSLRPHEALRKFVEDSYIRRPLALLIDTAQNNLEQIKTLWIDALRPNAPLDCVLLAYNASGVPVTYNFTNTRMLLAGINSIRASENSRGNGFFGIIRAIELIPYDSAIFVSTGFLPADENLAQYAATSLLKKRIRLYLTWLGDKTLTENETHEEAGGTLGRVAVRSGGEVILAENVKDIGYLTDEMVTLLSGQLQGQAEQEFPMQPAMLNPHTKEDTATLETPTGDDDLLSQKTMSVSVEDYVDNRIDYKRGFRTRSGKLMESNSERVRFPDQEYNEVADMDGGIIEVDKNIETNETKSRQEQVPNILPNLGTMIEMGAQSQLLLAPGSTGQLYYEITNLRNEPVFHTFQLTGQQRFLVSLNIQSFTFAPGQTITAIVVVRVPPNSQIGIKDQITFTCQGNGDSSKMATLKVIQTSEAQDGSQPNVHWRFGSRCDGNKLETGICADYIWSIDVTAHDWGTGLLRIQSTPRGIYTRNAYAAGTTSPVTAIYSANCCQPRVTISAYDLAGNARTVTIDVRDIYLTEAAIAAIVLGSLLLIALLVLIVFLIVWCCRKRRETLDLPTYRSHRRTSTT